MSKEKFRFAELKNIIFCAINVFLMNLFNSFNNSGDTLCKMPRWWCLYPHI